MLGALAELRPEVVVVDSIQTVYLQDVSSSAGSVTQARRPHTPSKRYICKASAPAPPPHSIQTVYLQGLHDFFEAVSHAAQ